MVIFLLYIGKYIIKLVLIVLGWKYWVREGLSKIKVIIKGRVKVVVVITCINAFKLKLIDYYFIKILS